MNLQNVISEIIVLAGSGIIIITVTYVLIKNDLISYIRRGKPKDPDHSKAQLLPLRLQAHERLVLFIERINPANLFLRLHHSGITLTDLHATVLNEIRSEYQHNITQQLYVSSSTWDVVSKLKDDTIAMVNSAVRSLPADAQGVDLSRKVLQHMASMDKNPYDLTLNVIKNDIHQLF